MTDTPIVDLQHWRAARNTPPAARITLPTDVTDDVTDGVAGAATRDASVSGNGAATVISMPAAATRECPPQHDPAVSGAPRSIFGPVMAFGLVPREPEPRLAAVGDDVPIGPRQRQLRSRHLADARGSSRGPAR